MRRAIRDGLLASAALLLAGVATQALWLGPFASRELSIRSGRAVHVDTMWLGLSSSLAPVLHFRGIRIDNAPWAASDRPLVALERATALFSWRSIEQRRPVVALWILADGEVDLERTADGLRNWRLTNPQYRGPGRWKVLAVQAERATVRFVDGGLDLDVRATASAASAAAAESDGVPRPTRIDVQGHWRRLPFSASADTGPVLTFFETGQSFPVRGHAEAGGARLDLDGTAGDIVRAPTLDAHVSLTATSLAPFAAFVSQHDRAAKAIRIEGELKFGADSYAVSGMKARIGATDLAGDLGWTRGDERSVVSAKLDSDSTDLADLRWLAGLARVGAAAGSAPVGQRTARDVDAELSFVARQLHAVELKALQSGALDASIADGRVTVSRFDIGIAQGHVAGRAAVDLRDPPMRMQVEATARGVRVESLLQDAAVQGRVTGALQGHALLTTHGDTAEAMRDGVSGRITVSLAGGTISSLLDAEIGLQGGKIVRSLVGGAEPIAIRCAVAVVDVEHGSGRLRQLVLDTDRTRTTGSGTIELAGETVDVVLTPEAKQGGLFNLERSIRLHGPLRHPARELVARVDAAGATQGECAPERS
jgi:uncharacterized protein involved in outer membrane biogenesis